jgi:hypothetical protein
MPARRIFGSDSKSELLPIVISPDELLARLQAKTGLQDLILENNRDHLISGRAYNTTGYVLQLFEYLGRNTTVAEITAASEDPKLTERTIATGVNRLNEILYKLLGLKVQHVKESGELRLVNQNDAISATEDFAKKFAKVRDEFVRTMDAYRATGGDVSGVLAGVDAKILAECKEKNVSAEGRTLAQLQRVLTPAREQVEA